MKCYILNRAFISFIFVLFQYNYSAGQSKSYYVHLETGVKLEVNAEYSFNDTYEFLTVRDVDYELNLRFLKSLNEIEGIYYNISNPDLEYKVYYKNRKLYIINKSTNSGYLFIIDEKKNKTKIDDINEGEISLEEMLELLQSDDNLYYTIQGEVNNPYLDFLSFYEVKVSNSDGFVYFLHLKERSNKEYIYFVSEEIYENFIIQFKEDKLYRNGILDLTYYCSLYPELGKPIFSSKQNWSK